MRSRLPGPIAIVGGTGHLGRPLAQRLHRAGVAVLIGSRDAARAQAAAEQIGLGREAGRANAEAVREAALVVITVPYEGHEATLRALAAGLAGKHVLETTVPYDRETKAVHHPGGRSAAERARDLAPGARLVAGFHTVSAAMLADLERPAHGDALLCGDDPEAKAAAASLAEAIGLRALDAGSLHNARVLEALAVLLFGMNRRYKKNDLGVTIAGLE